MKKEKKESKNINMKVQDWLDKKYPKANRSLITEIRIDNNCNYREDYSSGISEEDQLVGELDLSDFINLRKLHGYLFSYGYRNKVVQDITIKDLSKNTELEEVYLASVNQPINLDIFSYLTKIKKLTLNSERGGGWYGSLKSLENCKDLNYLDISRTNINSGLEYFPAKRFEELLEYRQFIWNRALKEQLISYNYDVRAWQIVNHPNLLSNNTEELVEELEKKIEQGEDIVENIKEGNGGWFLGNKMIYPCGIGIKKGTRRIKDKLKILRKDRTKKYQQIINQLKSEVKQAQQKEEEEASETHESVMEANTSKMIVLDTLQEQFERDFPDKSVKEIDTNVRCYNTNFTNYDLDLREYKDLEKVLLPIKTKLNVLNLEGLKKLKMLDCIGNELEHLNINGCNNLVSLTCSENNLYSLKLDDCIELKDLVCSGNNLTSIDFLNRLPNPDKLECLKISDNKIQPTNIKIFSKFINLTELKIGTTQKWGLSKGKHNKFYGSLKSYQNLAKLEQICIEATDVNEGLEYLPMSLSEASRGGRYFVIECSHQGLGSECFQIQNQLRPFNYDLEAWMLAHPHKLYNAKPELFFDSEVKSKWLSALRDKLNQTQEKLDNFRKNNPNETKKISRLESKIRELKLIQCDISNHSLIDKLQNKELIKKEQIKLVLHKEDKATQTPIIEQVVRY